MGGPTLMATKLHTFDEGAMWEGLPWILVEDQRCRSFGDTHPCRHCHSVVVSSRETTWVCPIVVVARNEAGCNSTGVCLRCILEGAASVGLAQ